MSHGECNDWWDFFDCPIWVAHFLDELGVINMEQADTIDKKIEVREVVQAHYKRMKDLQSKFLYEGSPSLEAINLDE
jgi:hypothetical protein